MKRWLKKHKLILVFLIALIISQFLITKVQPIDLSHYQICGGAEAFSSVNDRGIFSPWSFGFQGVLVEPVVYKLVQTLFALLYLVALIYSIYWIVQFLKNINKKSVHYGLISASRLLKLGIIATTFFITCATILYVMQLQNFNEKRMPEAQRMSVTNQEASNTGNKACPGTYFGPPNVKQPLVSKDILVPLATVSFIFVVLPSGSVLLIRRLRHKSVKP